VIGLDDFIDKLPRSSRGSVRKHEKSIDDGEYIQSPAELRQLQSYSMFINCMLWLLPRCPSCTQNDEHFPRPRCALSQRYNKPTTRVTRASGAPQTSSWSEKRHTGTALSSVNAVWCVPSTWTPQVLARHAKVESTTRVVFLSLLAPLVLASRESSALPDPRRPQTCSPQAAAVPVVHSSRVSRRCFRSGYNTVFLLILVLKVSTTGLQLSLRLSARRCGRRG